MPAPEVSKKKAKALKDARSKAELHAVRQRNVQIALVGTNVFVSVLIALRTFGFI